MTLEIEAAAINGALIEYPLTSIQRRFDIDHNTVDYPDHKQDIDGQQLDLRCDNTWTRTLEDTDIRECVESHLVNSIAPFYIIQLLTPILNTNTNSNQRFMSHIINITSQEGRFQKQKGSTHPHNNMTKAALNMLTKTLSMDYKRKYKSQVVTVDTGWANSMVGPTVMGKLSYFDSVARVVQPLVDNKDYSGTQLRHFENVGFNEPI
jgi:NAD(P)-dependent dehydrogenase (short-subunit alcohol dehydrogenase family)